MGSRHRSWVFTLNNYVDEEVGVLRCLVDKTCKWCIFGYEVGKEGTAHLQGALTLKNPKGLSGMKRILSRAHWEVMRGKAEDSVKYCTKDGKFEEYGERSQPGKRNDLDIVREAAKSSVPIRDLCDQVGFQGIRMAEKMRQYGHGTKRNWIMDVTWHCGPTGVGKTRAAFELMPDAYMITDGQWWDGYDMHKDVIIDDYRRDFCKFHVLLNILDRYPCRVPIKGGFVQLVAERVYITSPYCPVCTWTGRTEEEVQQLNRRITRTLGECDRCKVSAQGSGVILTQTQELLLAQQNGIKNGLFEL